MDRDKVEVHKHAKEEQGQYLDQTSLVNKGFITWGKTPKNDKFSLWDKACISRQDSSILPSQVANNSTRCGPSCLLTELDI